MEKQRLEDMMKVLKLNNSIDHMYKKLCELELKGEMNSEQYNEYIELIRFASNRCEDYMLKYELSDQDIQDYIKLLIDLNGYNQYDPVNYLGRCDNIKIKRFFEHNYELALQYHAAEWDESYDDKIIIENVEYDYETGMAKLEEEGYDEQLEDAKTFYEQSKEEKEQANDRDDLNYAQLQLEIHTFMLYLLDTIRREKNKVIKKKLIETKYRIISLVRSLEKSFLFDPELNIDLEYYHDKLHRVFKKRSELYPEFLKDLERIFEEDRMALIDRNKEEYIDADDQVDDILEELSLRTHLTTIPNESVRQCIIEDNEAAAELADGKIDQKILKRSIKINKKYIIKEIG